MVLYDWIDTYEQLANKLLEFKDNRQQLIQDIEDIYNDISLKYPFMDDGKPMEDIDPFTLFATFNRGITDTNRIAIIQKLIEKWGVHSDIPQSFDAIPLVNNMSAWFIAGNDRRQPNDIEQLWNLFESAIKYSENPNDTYVYKLFTEEFDKVRKQIVVSWKITFGLFWIRPYTFINLDKSTRNYLMKRNLLDENDTKEVPSGEKYLELCHKVKSELDKSSTNESNFPEISHLAYLESNEPHQAPIDFINSNDPALNQEIHYFWVNINLKGRGINNYMELAGQTIEYAWGSKDKASVRRINATSKIKVGDQVLLVDIEPDSGIFARGEVVSIPHRANSDYYNKYYPNSYVYDINITEVFDKVPRTIISEYASFKGTNLNTLLKGVSITELEKSQYIDIVDNINNVDIEEVEITNKLDFNKPLKIESLFFENRETIERQIQTALLQGKNIIFTGPPGTGKSKLAKIVADFYQADYKMITASSNWSTYETLGGYHPNKQNELLFKPGLFLSSVKDSQTGDNINQWLIIDELNRADIDKAFGSFFSVVTGDQITLPFEIDNGNYVQLIPEKEKVKLSKADHLYYYPNDWRMLATMNTADKASLFELSYAFMRRFAFINIDVPRIIDKNILDHYLSAWNVESYAYSEELADLWTLLNNHRKMGPAIIEDIVNYTLISNNLTDAILLYIMPQLEGMAIEELNLFIREMDDKIGEHIDLSQIKEFSRDFFGEAL